MKKVIELSREYIVTVEHEDLPEPLQFKIEHLFEEAAIEYIKAMLSESKYTVEFIKE